MTPSDARIAEVLRPNGWMSEWTKASACVEVAAGGTIACLGESFCHAVLILR